MVESVRRLKYGKINVILFKGKGKIYADINYDKKFYQNILKALNTDMVITGIRNKYQLHDIFPKAIKDIDISKQKVLKIEKMNAIDYSFIKFVEDNIFSLFEIILFISFCICFILDYSVINHKLNKDILMKVKELKHEY